MTGLPGIADGVWTLRGVVTRAAIDVRAVPGVRAEIVLTGGWRVATDAPVSRARTRRIADTRATFEAKGWARGLLHARPRALSAPCLPYRRMITRCCSAHRSASLVCMNVFASRGRPSTRITMPVYAR